MDDISKRRMLKFRENLKRLRLERVGTQHNLASRCNVHRSKISELESDEDSNLTLTTLFELAKGLGVKPTDLIDYDIEID